ncbi:hypothetical protein ACMZOO_00880 [Catenovulum sp. SX2]|uniref:hypothetical protein n=1 Tax=Catenovulum sp. SX2 TaxID=3398614 RepID=UPI003F87AF52
MSRILVLFIPLLFTNVSYAEFSCSKDVEVRSGDNFIYSASVYVVCDELANITIVEAQSLINGLLNRDVVLANEVFIFFIDSPKYIGSMDKAPFLIPENSLLGDYYNMTQRLTIWPLISGKAKSLVVSK